MVGHQLVGQQLDCVALESFSENSLERFAIAIFVEDRTAGISSIESMVNGTRFISTLRSQHYGTLPPRKIGLNESCPLFVAPALVFISLLMGNPLTLVFDQFELISLVAAVLIAALVSLDGESNWLEGAQLLVVYIIIGLAFFYLPT